MTTYTHIGSGLVALAIITAPALAQGPELKVTGDPQPSIRVSYADLNLGSASGVARLQSRVRSAVDQLCVVSGKRELAQVIAARECKRAAVAAALPQIEAATADHSRGQLAAAPVLKIFTGR